jgi:hypothetical protein
LDALSLGVRAFPKWLERQNPRPKLGRRLKSRSVSND